MAGNRKLPFGYRMERGEIKEHPMEADAVREIFRRYLAGASYTALVEHLRDTGPVYDEDKSWNKNMVARILENARYTGDGGFPMVIPPDDFQRVQKQRADRAAPSTKTPAQKGLRRLCGGNPPKYIESQVLSILNRLAADPEAIQAPETSSVEQPTAKTLRLKLAELLNEAPVDEEAARKTAMDLAASRLNTIGPEEYETERLRRLFKERTLPRELDAALLRASIRRIKVQNRRAIVELKNGQTVEGGK